MNFDLENSFPLVYLSGPLIITHGRRGPAPADPLPVGLDMHKLVIYHSIFGTYFIYNRNFSKNLLQSQVLFDFNEKNKISTKGIKYGVILLFNYYYRM
jgi:hypothetical protein